VKFPTWMMSRVTHGITKNSQEVSMQLSNLKRLFSLSGLGANRLALLNTPYSGSVRGREF